MASTTTHQPVNRRVQVRIQLTPPEDVELFAATALESRGWRTSQPAGLPEGEVLVDLLVYCTRMVSRGVALAELARFAEHQFVYSVVEAKLVEVTASRREFHEVVAMEPRGLPTIRRWLWRLTHRTFPRSPFWSVWVAPGAARDADDRAAEALTSSVTAGVHFDPSTMKTQVPLSPGPGSRGGWRSFFFPTGGLLAAVGEGALASAGPTWAWVVLGVVLVSIIPSFGAHMSSSRPRPRTVTNSVGAGMLIVFGLAGWFAAENIGRLGWMSPTRLALGGAVLLASAGVWHLRGVPLRTSLSVILPLIGSVFLVVPAGAHLLLLVYVQEGFGVPVGEFARDSFVDLLLVGRPLIGVMVSMAIALGLMGWLYYCGAHATTPAAFALMTILIVILYGLSGVASGLDDASSAVRATKAQARGDVEPDEWRGVQLRRICVTPIADVVASSGAALVTDHPILEIPTTGNRLWMWDPAAMDAPNGLVTGISVPRDQVATRFIMDGQSSC